MCLKHSIRWLLNQMHAPSVVDASLQYNNALASSAFSRHFLDLNASFWCNRLLGLLNTSCEHRISIQERWGISLVVWLLHRVGKPSPGCCVPNLIMVVHIAYCHVRFIVHYNFFPFNFSWIKLFLYLVIVPNSKGFRLWISSMRLVKKACLLYTSSWSNSSDNRPRQRKSTYLGFMCR